MKCAKLGLGVLLMLCAVGVVRAQPAPTPPPVAPSLPPATAPVAATTPPVPTAAQPVATPPHAAVNQPQRGVEGEAPPALPVEGASSGFAAARSKTEGFAESTTRAPVTDESVYLNVQDGEIRDIIKQISKATGRNFIIDDKIKGKITIISEKPMTKEEAYQTFLSALEVTGFTVVRGPAGILKIVPLRDAVQKPIPTHIDTTPMTDSFITRLIKLGNISALDMANAIKPLISKDGNLFAYPATNTLILTDSGSNIDRLMKIIKELDQEGPQQVLEIVRVQNASAKDIAQMVNSLFEQSKEGRPRPKPGEPEEIAEVSKIIPDERTNSIIVLASKRAIEKVREIIGRLDARLAEGQEGKIHVYYLKYAKAKTLAETLNSITAGSGQKPAAAGASGGGAPKIAELEGGVKVGFDESTNSLLVTASAKDFRTLVERVISKLDVLRRQVYLEAVVMELRINKQRNLGVSAHGGAGGNVIGFGQSFGAIPALQGSFLSGGASAPALLGGLISRQTVAVNVINPADGSTKSISIPAFSAFLSALSNYGDANIVSTPNLLTLDNEEATIEVRKELPIPGQQTIQANVAVAAPPTYEKAGLLMKIKPQIGYGDTVNLNIEQELSDFGPDKVINNNPVPTRIKRTIKTAVTCQDGQTVVLGGLMEDQSRNSKTKIPILGDIPILGLLFQQSSRIADKTNLLIFITPHIVKDATDFGDILKRKIEERNKFIQTNYGKRQQELIRDSIRTHREDLLEYKEGQPGDEPVSAPVAPLPAKSTAVPLPPQAASVQAGRVPVITAPGVSRETTGFDGVPLAPGVGIQSMPSGKKMLKEIAPQPEETSTWIYKTAPAPKEAAVPQPLGQPPPPVVSPKMPAIPPGAVVPADVPLSQGKGLSKAPGTAPVRTAPPVPASPTTPEPGASSGTWKQIQNGAGGPAPSTRKNGLQLGY